MTQPESGTHDSGKSHEKAEHAAHGSRKRVIVLAIVAVCAVAIAGGLFAFATSHAGRPGDVTTVSNGTSQQSGTDSTSKSKNTTTTDGSGNTSGTNGGAGSSSTGSGNGSSTTGGNGSTADPDAGEDNSADTSQLFGDNGTSGSGTNNSTSGSSGTTDGGDGGWTGDY